MSLLITGAAGFAGSHLLDLLTPRHTDVVAWQRPGGRAPAAHDSATRATPASWDSVDLLDRTSVREAVARVRPRVVYHCAGAAHVGKAWDRADQTFAVNVRATHNLLDALDAAGVQARVLIPGSALVYAGANR